jgi:hypothetical protein
MNHPYTVVPAVLPSAGCMVTFDTNAWRFGRAVLRVGAITIPMSVALSGDDGLIARGFSAEIRPEHVAWLPSEELPWQIKTISAQGKERLVIGGYTRRAA